MTRCVAQTVDDAALPFVRNEHVGISGDAVLEACAAAEKTVRRIEFFIAHQMESVFGSFECGAEEFGVAGAEPVVPCAPNPDDNVPVLSKLFIDQQFPGFIGENGEQGVFCGGRAEQGSCVPGVECGVTGPRRAVHAAGGNDGGELFEQSVFVEEYISGEVAAGNGERLVDILFPGHKGRNELYSHKNSFFL